MGLIDCMKCKLKESLKSFLGIKEHGILTGEHIKEELGDNILIYPYHPSRVNPNSYNLCLHNKLLVYTGDELDSKKKNFTEEIDIPENGFLLQPGEFYLGRTVERTFTKHYVPMIEGRSSIARLGICVHLTAGFGDHGFNGCWTLEITCEKPVRVYPDMEICQIYYHTLKGERTKYDDDGKYQDNNAIQPSMLYKEYGG